MAGRNANIGVSIKGEAEFDKARAEAKDALDDIEKAADGVEISPKLDTAEIRQAIDLAKSLDGLVANFTVDTDISELDEAAALARSLRGFQGRVDLDVEGRAELTEVLGLAEKLDQIRQVRVEVQGRQDLEKAQQLADDLERRRSVPIDAQASDLVRLDDQVGDAITAGGEAGAAGVAGALGDVDFTDIGASARDQLTGALAAAGPWAAVAAGVGAIFGDEFLEGFNNALPSGRQDTIRGLRENLSEDDLRAAGVAGGEAYSAGLSEGLTDAKDAAALIQGELGRIDDDLDLTEVTRQALALEQVFGTDLRDSVAAVDKLVSQGLVKNSEEGFNLLFELGRQTGVQFDEMIELTSEFSTAIEALGINGPKGLKLIGEMVERGIFPQVDQAGEVFEELNETIISGGAADALEAIGFNAAAMQETIAGGGPRAAEAVADIAQQILLLDSDADQAAATTAIFGGNMGLLGDDAREAALELFATADQIGAVGGAASDAADDIEESASGLDRLKLVATDLGEEVGTAAASLIDLTTALADMDWDTAIDKAGSFGEILATKVGGPLFDIADRLGLDPLGPAKDGFEELFGSSEKLATSIPKTKDGLDETAEASENLSGGVYDAAAAVDELEDEFRGLFDFSADQLMRDVAEATDELAESLKNGGAEAVGMNGAIDISTEAGRKLQEQMEDLNGVLVDLAVAQANGEISADQYKAATAELTGALSANGSEANVTKDKVEGLRQKYLDVEGIDSIQTDFVANTERALNNVTALSRAIAGIKDKSVTISASVSGPVGITSSIKLKARGGWTDGLTIVGEEGPELIDVKGRAFVHTAAETRDILSNRGGDLGGGAPGVAGGPRINIEQLVVDKGVDLWQQLDLAELVYGA